MNVSELKPGERIRLVKMGDDPDPITPGTCGTVDSVVRHGSDWIINMKSWDNGRTLNPVCPPDVVERV